MVIVTCEDGLADTVKPRLIAAGADLERVRLIETISLAEGDAERLPSIPEDIPFIELAIKSVKAKLVIFDPLVAFLTDAVDSKIDHRIRRALGPLAVMAERMGVAVVVLRHLTKDGNQQNPLYRGGGTIAFTASARAVILVGNDPQDPERRVLAWSKVNVARLPRSLAYTVTGVTVEGVKDSVAAIEWKGASELSARDLLAAAQQRGTKEKHARNNAMKFLASELSSGPKGAAELKRRAKVVCITERTLNRAKKDLGVVSDKTGFDGDWSWKLPDRLRIPGEYEAASTSPKAASGEHLAAFEPQADVTHIESDASSKMANTAESAHVEPEVTLRDSNTASASTTDANGFEEGEF